MANIFVYNSHITIKSIEYATNGDIARVIEYLTAMGPSDFYTMKEDIQIVGSALLDHLAVARSLGLIKLAGRNIR